MSAPKKLKLKYINIYMIYIAELLYFKKLH